MAGDQDGNVRRLRALMVMFPGLTIQDIAKVGKTSRPTVSGLLAGRPEVKANGLFGELERNLATLIGIAGRRHSFFSTEGVPAERAEEAVRSATG